MSKGDTERWSSLLGDRWVRVEQWRQRDGRSKKKTEGQQSHRRVGEGARQPCDWGEQMDGMLMLGPRLPV